MDENKPNGSLYELEIHVETARKLLTHPEWRPTRILWKRLTDHLDSAVNLLKSKP